MGENLESFEHWKRLFSLLCCSGSALRHDDPLSGELIMKLVPVIYEQLK
jgi:hypothetical protein